MGRQIDHTGEVCGDFKVIKIDHKTKRKVYWEAQCVYCGKKIVLRSDNLCNNTHTQCVCQRTGNPDYQTIKLIGRKFGELTVLEMEEESKNHTFYPCRKNHHSKWICVCSCGNKTVVSQTHLITGHTKTCGSAKNHLYGKYVNNLVGQRFGLLQVIQRAENVVYKGIPYVAWKCKCDCGNTTIVISSNLKNGSTKSCGCINSQGEGMIQKYCTQYNILHEKQYRFEDCRDRYPLPFDFAFFDCHKRPILLLEYDGIQHFFPQRWSNNTTYDEMMIEFHQLQRRDMIKTEYCKNNGITLLRIPYTQLNNIFSIMDFIVSTYNLKKGQYNEKQ